LGAGPPAVTAVGFGAMPLSISDRPDEAQGIQVIHSALDAGMTLVDTADVYCLDDDNIGHNERLIAKALAAWSGDRDSIVVATKAGLTRPGGRWETDGRPAHVRAACERSLKALGVDRIDLYQFHAPDPEVPFTDSVGVFADLQQEGKVRWVGLSNVSVDEIEAARDIVEVATVQNRLNPFFNESPHDGVVKYCNENGIGYLAYSPVGGGRLNKNGPFGCPRLGRGPRAQRDRHPGRSNGGTRPRLRRQCRAGAEPRGTAGDRRGRVLDGVSAVGRGDGPSHHFARGWSDAGRTTRSGLAPPAQSGRTLSGELATSAR
jgi:aryl-alcohol dehydrogenase-like predicted oxidoreductase